MLQQGILFHGLMDCFIYVSFMFPSDNGRLGYHVLLIMENVGIKNKHRVLQLYILEHEILEV